MSKYPNVCVVTPSISQHAKQKKPMLMAAFDLTDFAKFIKSYFKDGLFLKFVGSTIEKLTLIAVNKLLQWKNIIILNFEFLQTV